MPIKAAVPQHSAQPATPSQPPTPSFPCVVSIYPDGTGAAEFRIEPEIMRRINNRRANVSFEEYIWINIIRPALEGHVY